MQTLSLFYLNMHTLHTLTNVLIFKAPSTIIGVPSASGDQFQAPPIGEWKLNRV